MKDRINIKQDRAMTKIAELTHTKPIRLPNSNGYMFIYERVDSFSFMITADGKIINKECFYWLLAEYNQSVISVVNDDVISEACANIG